MKLDNKIMGLRVYLTTKQGSTLKKIDLSPSQDNSYISEQIDWYITQGLEIEKETDEWYNHYYIYTDTTTIYTKEYEKLTQQLQEWK